MSVSVFFIGSTSQKKQPPESTITFTFERPFPIVIKLTWGLVTCNVLVVYWGQQLFMTKFQVEGTDAWAMLTAWLVCIILYLLPDVGNIFLSSKLHLHMPAQVTVFHFFSLTSTSLLFSQMWQEIESVRRHTVQGNFCMKYLQTDPPSQ